MNTTVSDDKAFIEHIIDNTVLESAIDFIKDRFSAEEVYGKDALEVWATYNGFTSDKEVEGLEEEIETLKDTIKELQNIIDEHNE